MRVLYGDGSQFQQIGIVPDVRVDPEIEDFAVGKDRVLEKAVEVLNSTLFPAIRRHSIGPDPDVDPNVFALSTCFLAPGNP